MGVVSHPERDSQDDSPHPRVKQYPPQKLAQPAMGMKHPEGPALECADAHAGSQLARPSSLLDQARRAHTKDLAALLVKARPALIRALVV